jgi:hypothetical protein
VDGDDVWVIELCRSLCFASETQPQVFLLSEMLRHKLQGDAAIEPGILSQVDFSHPAGADLFNDTVMADHCVGSQLDVETGVVVEISHRIFSLGTKQIYAIENHLEKKRSSLPIVLRHREPCGKQETSGSDFAVTQNNDSQL